MAVVLAVAIPLPLPADETISGRAMGMMYQCDFGEELSQEQLQQCRELIAEELERIEAIFSLYRDDSEISRWNADKSLEPIRVSEDFFALVQQARFLNQAGDGAFDPTIRPLVKAWKFDWLETGWKPPHADEIRLALSKIGLERIEINETLKTVRKTQAEIELDLNALVEGWAIDRIVARLQGKYLGHFLFALGGEFYASGCNRTGHPWTIGIEDPDDPYRLVGQVRLQNQALAVSGNYRSGRASGGKWYSHLLDPRTGYPSRESPSLVAVTAKSAFEADGWATALMIAERGRAVEQADRQALAAWFVESIDGHSVATSSLAGKDVFMATSKNSKPRSFEISPNSIPFRGLIVVALSGFVAWHLYRRLIRAR